VVRILIVTDAWFPQINGVVTTLSQTGHQLTLMGHEVCYLTPQDKPTIPVPTYPEIRLALARPSVIRREIEKFGTGLHSYRHRRTSWLACQKILSEEQI